MPRANASHLTLVDRNALGDAIADFIIDRRSRRLSPRTIEFYGEELAGLAAYLERRHIEDVRMIDAPTLRAFLLDVARRRNPGGTHAAFRAARCWLRWAWEEYDLLDTPCPIDRVAGPRVNQEPLAPVSLETVKAMMHTCSGKRFLDVRDKALLAFLLDTGARASEVLSLDVADLDLSAGTAMLRRGKGGKGRTLYYSPFTSRLLAKYMRSLVGPGALWRGRDDRRLQYAGLRAVLRKRAGMAGTATPQAHDFRRAFAALSLKAGCDVVTLSRLLGHSNLATVQRYIKQSTSDLQAARPDIGQLLRGGRQ